MKKVKKLIVGFVVVVLLVILSIPLWIDRAARVGIETGGSFALGVPTKLDGIDIGLLSGTSELTGLSVANPKGFSADPFLRLNGGKLAVSLGSLRTDTVEIPEFSLSGIGLNLEKKLDGANYKVILDNVGRFESKGSSGSASSEPSQDGGKKFVVREIVIKDVTVNAAMAGLGDLGKVSVKIDEIRLNNVGSGSDKGVLMGELVNTILKAILAATLQKGGLPADLMSELQGSLASLKSLEQLGTSLAVNIDGTLKQVAGQAQAAAQQVGEAAKQVQAGAAEAAKQVEAGAAQAADQAKSAAKSVTEGLGNLLPKTEEKKP